MNAGQMTDQETIVRARLDRRGNSCYHVLEEWNIYSIPVYVILLHVSSVVLIFSVGE